MQARHMESPTQCTAGRVNVICVYKLQFGGGCVGVKATPEGQVGVYLNPRRILQNRSHCHRLRRQALRRCHRHCPHRHLSGRIPSGFIIYYY